MKQTFDEFLDEYLNEQDETVRAEYEKVKEELLENSSPRDILEGYSSGEEDGLLNR